MVGLDSVAAVEGRGSVVGNPVVTGDAVEEPTGWLVLGGTSVVLILVVTA